MIRDREDYEGMTGIGEAVAQFVKNGIRWLLNSQSLDYFVDASNFRFHEEPPYFAFAS